jgi:hypothetical protein
VDGYKLARNRWTIRKPAPWNGKWSTPTVLYLEEGGFIFEHMRRWRQLGQSDADVEIRGPCFSACTLIIAVVPKQRLCFGDYASLQFHAASDLSGRIRHSRYHVDAQAIPARYLRLAHGQRRRARHDRL